MFEFFAGLESDKYPFGLGDICVMQPKCTILITYLTSDLLRVFPWRGESPAFVSQPLGCTLCCITQLSNETVAVTSSSSDQLSFLKVGVCEAVVVPDDYVSTRKKRNKRRNIIGGSCQGLSLIHISEPTRPP